MRVTLSPVWENGVFSIQAREESKPPVILEGSVIPASRVEVLECLLEICEELISESKSSCEKIQEGAEKK